MSGKAPALFWWVPPGFAGLLVAAGIGVGRVSSGRPAVVRISVATVKTHVSRLFSKLRAHDRAQLVVIAYETGLVERARRR